MLKATIRSEGFDGAGDILSNADMPNEKSKEFEVDKRKDILNDPGPLISG